MFERMWNSGHFRHHHWHEAAGRRGWGPGGRGRGGPFGPPDWFGDFFGPPPRADRGGVRYLVLDAIAAQPRHGYEVISAIEERSHGQYRPSPGVVYPTLQLLEELRHATVAEQDGRKIYAITEEGKSDLEAHRDEVSAFYERSDGDRWERQAEDFHEQLHQAARLFKTYKRAARHGGLSLKAQAAIREVIEDAVKRIQQIMDDEGRSPR
jgi:DNA-binding PadR family transcriptional regulator